ncbi:hypothetical protein HK098_004776 [Nowakowskiella sp. JEL0407]|nr:hypothetical protein HK098_004776 [Nowakowskiella sp. JEL0407]
MVTPQYIYESELAKKFLNEEEWEWRADNGNTEFNVAKLWRLYLRRPGNTMTGVFHAWKVYMAMENMDKAEPMKRVLEAGGAEVRISGEPAFPIPADEEYTHCVADGKYIEAASRLEQEGFTVTTIQTIAQILVKGPVPNYTEE